MIVDRYVRVPEPIHCLGEEDAPPSGDPVPPPAFCEAGKPCPSACPLEHVCYPKADAATLDGNIDELQEWARLFWRLCRPPASQPATRPVVN